MTFFEAFPAAQSRCKANNSCSNSDVMLINDMKMSDSFFLVVNRVIFFVTQGALMNNHDCLFRSDFPVNKSQCRLLMRYIQSKSRN